MHADANLISLRYAPNLLQFLAANSTVPPGINAMESDLAARIQQVVNRIRNVSRRVSCSAERRSPASTALTRPVFERNHEKRRTKAVLQFQIPIVETLPEVLRKAELDK